MKKTLALALALLAIAPAALAQDFPSRNITLVVPLPPGGPSDTAAWLITGPMSKALGQQIVVENVTGAAIGSNRVAKAKPDGYTLGMASSGAHAAAEFLQKDLQYRASDFEYVGMINQALNTALNDPDVVKRFADLSYSVAPPTKRSHSYFDGFVKDEVAVRGKIFGSPGAGKK